MSPLKALSLLSWIHKEIHMDAFYSLSCWSEQLLQSPSDVENILSYLSIPLDRSMGSRYWDWLRQQEELLIKNRIHHTFPSQSDYPEEFLSMSRPALSVTYRGNVNAFRACKLGVIGSRSPLPDSLSWMDLHLSSVVHKQQTLAIVSGGARGIDQKAHFISLRARRPTVCFLPSGILCPYPYSFLPWLERIEQSDGLVVSPFAPKAEMRKYYFHIRNRLIAAISQVVLVVEARRKGGSMLTARLALEEGKVLATLPASPSTIAAQGNLDLLADGAHMVRDDMDLTALLYLSTSQ